MRQPVQVLVYPVKDVGGDWQYLLLRRVPRPALGMSGFWQGITGGAEEGEELADAAMRELTEETGLVPSALEQVDYSYSFAMQEQWRGLYADGVEQIVEHVFVATVDALQDPVLSGEHDRWEWCGLERALRLLVHPENVEALKRCDAWLRRQ